MACIRLYLSILDKHGGGAQETLPLLAELLILIDSGERKIISAVYPLLNPLGSID